MPEVSLTTLIDFVLASSSPKLTVVRNAKRAYQQGHSRATDYYKELREAIVDYHQRGLQRAALHRVAAGQTAPKKSANFQRLVDEYVRWLGRKNLQWVRPDSSVWSAGGLRVRLNPELLDIAGNTYAVKLYFKATPLPANRAVIITRLLDIEMPVVLAGATSAVLDIGRRKLHTPGRPVAGIDALLEVEARSFASLWRSL